MTQQTLRSPSPPSHPAPAAPTAPTPATPTTAPVATRLSLFTVLLGGFLSIADYFIVNVALPTIGTDLSMGSGALELVVAGYGTPFAVLLVLGGRLGDAFGRRTLFLTGMAGFTIATVLCGLAPNGAVLIGARALQGVFAALMVPQVLATIQATTQGHQRARAMGLYAAMAGIATVVGQVVGGLLLASDSSGAAWRPVFLVTVPFGVLGLVLAVRHVPATRAESPAAADIPGTLLLGGALFALLASLTEGRAQGWPIWSWVLLAATPLLGAAFWRVEKQTERRGRTPLVPPSLLARPSLRLASLATLAFMSSFAATMFAISLTLQQGAHLSPVATGLAVAPIGIGTLVTSTNSARLGRRFGNSSMTFGAVTQFLGLALVAVTVLSAWPHLEPWQMAPGLLVAGLGQGLVIGALMHASLADVPLEMAGVGGGLVVTVQQVSLAIGVGVIGGLYLSIASHSPARALVCVLGIQMLAALVVAFASRRLPDRR